MIGMANIDTLLTDHLDIWTSAIARKSTAGRGRSKKFSLYGIEKLRSLILELAVRGKLVLQDPNDEPASELLKQIEAEKVRLLKTKGLRASKATRALSATQRNQRLPRGWVWSQLAEVGFISPRNTASDDQEASFVPMPMIAAEYGVPHEHEVRNWGEIKKGYTHFAEGDVGLAKITPCFENGKSTVFRNLTGGIGSGTTELHIVRPVKVDPDYIVLFLKSPSYIAAGIPKMTGSAGQKRAPTEFFSSFPFPLPPLAEQHRIVAKVDELIALCDRLEAGAYEAIEAHQLLVTELLATLTASRDANELAENWARIEIHFDTLFVTEYSVDQLKQTILQLAVMGRLSHQIKSDDKSNQHDLRPDDQAESFDLKAFHARASLFPLPEGWLILPLSRVCTNIVDCPHTTPKWTEEGCICVKSDQVKPGYLDLTTPNYVSEETFIQRIGRLEPQENDILFKREGGILGVAARIPPNTKLCLGQRLMLVRATNAVLPEFLELVLNSKWITDFAMEKTTGGAAPRVNMAIVRAFPIPVPPLREQVRIIAKIDELMALCNAYSLLAKEATDQQIQMTDTIVARALN